ncbi:MAG: exodeoxyribonuclease VII large subunit [Ignavibacteriae bacterium]|nr:exodeoxyribonuclease VII large subunit [Ignavibacteriota bacterium]
MFEIDSNTISVSQLTQKIKSVLEEDFSRIEVVGEISNFTSASSGHKYFTLKDSNAQISAVMWRSTNVSFPIENGMKVNVKGSISVYPPRGSYQLVVTSMRPQGIGDLYLAYEKLKKELLDLGYFSAENKKKWPIIPQRIGVSTSPTGAALHDIISTLERRSPFAEIYLYPVMVQGNGSEKEIAHAINELDKLELDVIIIGRGGGSIEDLWSYNTRDVADAIYNAKTPIVAGVGHETDTTIADLVADHRAPTPTGAAEIVSINTIDIIRQTLDENQLSITNSINNSISNYKKELNNKFDRLKSSGIKNSIDLLKLNLDSYEKQLHKQILLNIQTKKIQLKNYANVISKMNPALPLEKGYAMILKNGERVKTSQVLSKNDKIKIIRNNNENIAIIEE